MSLWDVQRDTRDGRILAIRPAGFKGWGKLDGEKPLAIKQEELGQAYFDKDALAVSKGGDGLTKTAAVLAKEQAASEIPDADIVAEVKSRGLAAMIEDAIREIG